MAFNWSELLNLAKNLTGQECSVDPEAVLRAAVSRAYFAAYGVARKYAINNLGFDPRNSDGGDHGRLVAHLKNHGKNYQIANNLHDLRMWRNHCDYDDSIDNKETMVTNALRLAQKIIDTMTF